MPHAVDIQSLGFAEEVQQRKKVDRFVYHPDEYHEPWNLR